MLLQQCCWTVRGFCVFLYKATQEPLAAAVHRPHTLKQNKTKWMLETLSSRRSTRGWRRVTAVDPHVLTSFVFFFFYCNTTTVAWRRARAWYRSQRIALCLCRFLRFLNVYIYIDRKATWQNGKSVISIKSHIAVHSADYECSFGPRCSLESSARFVFLSSIHST